jgi:hypothetical protein
MATINRIYPHVNVTTRALIRTAPVLADDEATAMFVPFYAKKGLSNEVQKIYNLDQFISEYGEPDFDYQGRTILNIYNWLNAGGAIYALRLVSPDAEKAQNSEEIGGETLTITAKYPGEYYNDIKVRITKSDYSTAENFYMNIDILENEQLLQRMSRLKYNDFVERLNKTKWFNAEFTGETEADFKNFLEALTTENNTISMAGGSDGTFTFEQSLQRFLGSENTNEIITTDEATVDLSDSKFTFSISDADELANLALNNWTVGDILTVSDNNDPTPTENLGTISNINWDDEEIEITFDDASEDWTDFTESSIAYTLSFNTGAESTINIYKVLESKLELPIDIIMDPGYSLTAKELLKTFSTTRDDIFYIFSSIDFSESEIGNLVIFHDSISEINQAFYTQKLSVEDVISGKNLWVAPTYFLARLIPNNDRVYGMQWPTAGLSRGVLTGVQGINLNPTSDEKTSFYSDRINYIEKDSRGYKFMSQLTSEPENTALRFINNARVTNKMIRDLENIGREYLFEFNDSTTLSNMRAALNRYVTEWVQNRTLNFADVVVESDEFLEEKVNVTLTIRFTGTIEVISIDITIE